MSKTNGCVVSKTHSRAPALVVRARRHDYDLPPLSTDRLKFRVLNTSLTIGIGNFCYFGDLRLLSDLRLTTILLILI